MLTRYLAVLVSVMFLLWPVFTFNSDNYFKKTQVLEKNRAITKVVWVIDGDTVVLANGQKVRYIGINTPEIDKSECFSREAYEENKKLVAGKVVRLEKDVSETDRYERLLRYVWVGNIFINESLVTNGLAKVDTRSPDIKFANLFFLRQRQAKDRNRGLWKQCVK